MSHFSRVCYNRNMKKILIFPMILCCLLFSTPLFALSEAQQASISERCTSIKHSLKNLQKIDSKNRIYLGSKYEIILSRFMTPLNLRLVKNNMSTTVLSDFQTDFATHRAEFNADFITYSKSLEELIAINCEAHPQKFYEQLEKTRELRAKVQTDIILLSDLLSDYKEHVILLKESL